MKYLKLFAVFGALALVGAGSATLLDVFGTISGTVEVEPAVEIDEIYYSSSIDGQNYGEYIIIRANTEIDLTEWSLVPVGEDVEVNNISETVSEGDIALVDNKSAVSNPSAVDKIYEIGTIDESGLTDTGETLSLSFKSTGDEVDSVDYSGSDCSNSASYMPESDSCEPATLDIGGGN